jgi:hypothetical protein
VRWAAVGWADRLDWFDLFFLFLFFSNPFQTNFKPFKFKSFSCFQTQILTQIYSTILRLLENLLNHFSNIKFKLSSFFFNSNFHTNFHNYFQGLFHKKILRLFTSFFKTFKTTQQPKLMHFNMMHKHLGDSN